MFKLPDIWPGNEDTRASACTKRESGIVRIDASFAFLRDADAYRLIAHWSRVDAISPGLQKRDSRRRRVYFERVFIGGKLTAIKLSVNVVIFMTDFSEIRRCE